jgi:transposase-like protein
MLSELARLGARLIIKRAVEDEFDQWLGRARYERRVEAGPARRNGFRPRRLQTAEGELRIELPQVREAAPFVSRLFYHGYTKRLIRTVQAKLPKPEHDRVRIAFWKALNEATGVKDGKLRLQILIADIENAGYEAAARCLADDLEALVVHLRYPLRHRHRWRSTNLLERSFGEVRRRTKVMGRFPGETSCLSLVWAVLDLFFTHASNGPTFTELDRQHLYRIKNPPIQPVTDDEEVTAA